MRNRVNENSICVPDPLVLGLRWQAQDKDAPGGSLLAPAQGRGATGSRAWGPLHRKPSPSSLFPGRWERSTLESLNLLCVLCVSVRAEG